ncbi:MAG: potassium transporter TrkG [Planctomycetota bacterium]
MNFRLTLFVLGWLLVFMGVVLLFPILFSLWFGDGEVMNFLASAVLTAGAGYGMTRWFRSDRRMTIREGFGIVTFGWLAFAIFGALPYLFGDVLSNPIDAFFESMSGFSTTGSTVITDLEPVPESILVWRSLTQWLGGMGIIVLSLAILPVLGVGGMQLFEAEVPGPTADRLRPRIQDTAKLLWGVYFFITALEAVFLMFGGMNFYEAVCHSLTTMATGGFSTENASIGAWDSTYIHVVITCFMFLAGVNFSLHFHCLRGSPKSYLKSEEFRFYVGLIAAAVLALFLFNLVVYDRAGTNLRDSTFNAVSLMTTTGYGTADYEGWPIVSQYMLITLMFVGGCAGSTGGGMKVVRVMLLLKHSVLQVTKLIHPKQVRFLKMDHKPVGDDVIQSILGFFALYIGLFLFASLAMAAFGVDLVTSGASVIACLSNIGPGLGDVGPTDNFAGLPGAGKVLLTFCMLFGRLELFTVMVVFVPAFWRK